MNRGKILLVGFGPGSKEHMTYRARAAIAESDVVIGYSTYIDLVDDLLAGKEVIRKGMTEEIDRCVEAYEQAKQGKTVALVSSGDIGVYGMAGPTYEVLLQSGWTPNSDVEVEVVPGSTALSACASLVGAPLTHDFCSISLSDLLTPWPVIARRLQAAARSDFVTALYNPKSGRRTQQIVEAQKIFLQYRDPATPVAVVKSAYRDLQDIQLVTLQEMSDCKIGMLTTVLIGNSSTRLQEGLMITPRGYANKYDGITGEVKEGEKRGRSLSVGLTGWKAGVRAYLREQDNPSLRQVADYFDVPVQEIASAIAEANSVDMAGDYSAALIGINNCQSLLDSIQSWGDLRVVMRSEGGAFSELMLRSDQLVCEGDKIRVETEHFHLHCALKTFTSAALVRCADRLFSVYFFDKHGQDVFNISLMRKHGQFSDKAVQAFLKAWQTLLPR